MRFCKAKPDTNPQRKEAFDKAKAMVIKMKRLYFLIAFVLCALCFVACNQGGGVSDVTTTGADVGENGGKLCFMENGQPAAVICEIVNEDGTMARRDNLVEFSKKHGLKFVTVAQLIEYRLQKEMFMKREATAKLPSDFGDFRVYGYTNELGGVDQVAIVKDDGSDKVPMVRVHSECLTGDIFHSRRCDCQNQLESALRLIEEYGKGAFVYIRGHEGRGIGLVNKIKAYALQEKGQDTVQANISLGFQPDLRNYGIGAQILRDLGYTKFKLITNNPTKIVALSGYGLEVVDRVSLKTPLNEYNQRYIQTKVDKMEHLIDL